MLHILSILIIFVMSFAKDVSIRNGAFIHCINEIATEFKFAHPACKARLLQIYSHSYYGSNLWDLYGQEFLSLCKTWNIGIRKLFDLPYQTYCRFIPRLYEGVIASYMLK